MATTKEYRDYVTDQLNTTGNIICRPMMGEYLLYYNNQLFGGIYEERLLIKKAPTNEKYQLPEQIPYKGAKAMYWLEEIEDTDLVREIILETCKGLPIKKK